MFPYVYFEGDYVSSEEAKISVATHAFLYGTSVFEGIRAYWNEKQKKCFIFRPLEHFQRLHQSAKILRLELDKSPEEMVEITKNLLKKINPNQDVYIRPIGYKAGLRIGPSLLHNPTDFCIFCVPMGDYIDTTKGISVTVSNWRRIEDNAIPPRAKIAGSYVNTALAKTDALLSNFADAIVLDERGHVSEGSAMNLFVVRDGKLITSGVTDNILEGITRATLFELAKKELGLEYEERSIDRTELYVADEMFFCGTGAQISPITQVDYYEVGNGQVGPITSKLKNLYFQLVRNELPQYSQWCIEV
ncbi:MAG: branched-chain amino acid transaminase [Candidatus Caenarcaniphilales bacterium]|nr:branched-chain amino acid transaminase [Candidatus Caenarcaniphilales bacterium]